LLYNLILQQVRVPLQMRNVIMHSIRRSNLVLLDGMELDESVFATKGLRQEIDPISPSVNGARWTPHHLTCL